MAKEVGLSLADIGIPYELVSLGDQKLRVEGIPFETVLQLFMRFPAIQTWLGGSALKVADVIAAAPDMAAAIIASATKGDEEKASLLPAEVQFDVLEAVARLTFRSGFGPFVERVLAVLVKGNDVVQSGPSGKAPVTNSAPPSTTSSAPDTNTTQSGK